jgi:phage baseplate assembly protein W
VSGFFCLQVFIGKSYIMQSYNIKFPLTDDFSTNTFFMMTQVTKDAFSADLLLLLLTQKGERYYESDYGTNLLKFIFEPNDNLNATDIEEEIRNTVSAYIPNLKINKVTFNFHKDDQGNTISESQLNVNVSFTYTEDSFSESGELELNF